MTAPTFKNKLEQKQQEIAAKHRKWSSRAGRI